MLRQQMCECNAIFGYLPAMRAPLKHIFIPLVVIVAGAGVAFALVSQRDDLPRRNRPALPPVVQVTTVEPGDVPVTITSRGVVRPQRSIDLVSEVSGRVVWVDPGFLQGAHVSAGQLLLRIDPIDYQVAVSDAHAAVASAELALAEVKVVVMKAAIAEAEARLVAAKERLLQAETDLANTEVRAPFDAIVDTKRVDLGQYVQTGTSMMGLFSTQLAEVRLPILGSDVRFVSVDEEAPEATLTASLGATDLSWRARLDRLENRVDEQTRVFYLVAQVERPYDESLHGEALALGQFVEVSFSGDLIPDAVRLPRSALHEGEFVFVVHDGTIQRRAVKLIRQEQDAVIVSGELSGGVQVVVSRMDLMTDGMLVRVSD